MSGYKKYVLLNCLLITCLICKCGAQGTNQWQGGSVNAIPDSNGNWQYVGNPSQDNAIPTAPPVGGNGPAPIRVNSQGNGGQRWTDRPNMNQDPGRNPQDLNKIFQNSNSSMKDMMRGMFKKAQQAGNKLMNALKDKNGTLVFTRMSRQFIPSACSQEMLKIQSDCFSKNGYTMDSFFHILRNGSFTADKTTDSVNSIKDKMCNKRQDILDCTIPAILGKRDKAPCLDVHDYNFAQEMALKGVKIIQDICAAGLLPPPPICVPLVNRAMQRCYSKVGFSQDMFIADDKDVEGAVIGKDMEAANTFCGSRKELYECMRLVLRNCPEAEKHLLITGHDQTAIEKSIDVLCDNKKVYVDGLNCFQTPSETVHNCIEVMSSQTLDLEARQMWKNMGTDEFYKEFCRIRVQHMECDTTAWKESCHKVTVGLKNEFQCAMLPRICHNVPEINDILHQKVCRKEAYLQALRAPYNGVKHLTSGIVSSVLSIGLSLVFLMF